MNSMQSKQNGFTIVELMIASTVFSVILILCTFGLINIGRVYYKGVTTSRTQEAARTIMDEIAQAIQFGGKSPNILATSLGGVDGVCIDSRRYSFRLGIKQNDAPNSKVLVADTTTCGAGTTPLDISNGVAVTASTDPREFLSGDMRLANLEVAPVNEALGLYSIHVRVVAGAYDLLTPTPSSPTDPSSTDVQCKNDLAGGQFCAVADLSTVVQKRVK